MKQPNSPFWGTALKPTNWKIGHKFLALLVWSIIFAVAILSTYNYYSLSTYSIDQAEVDLQHLAAQSLDKLANSIQGSVDELQTLALSPSIIGLAQEANGHNSLTESAELEASIAKRDQAWKDEDPSVETLVETIAQNEVSISLRNFIQLYPMHAEVFITDKTGLNVAMTERTGDYWQADETWWLEAYNEGQGTLYIGPVEFDESTGVWAVNVGIPIRTHTDQEIAGILRSTLDISQIMGEVSNAIIDKGLDVILVDLQGTILYTVDSKLLMTSLSDSSLRALVEAQTLTAQHDLKDLDGNPAVTVFAPLTGNLSKHLNWGILLSKNLESINTVIRKALRNGIIIALLVVLVCGGVGFWLTYSFTQRITLVTEQAQRLAAGNLTKTNNQEQSTAIRSLDEVGDLSRAFDELQVYLQQAAQAACQIAHGDLRTIPEIKGSQDVLGNAFYQMVTNLRVLIGQITDNANDLGAASSQLTTSTGQASQTTLQIAQAMYQVADSTQYQTQSAQQTKLSVEQIICAINGVAKGAQAQATSITKSATIADQMGATIQSVTTNAQTGATRAANAAQTAREGASIVDQTIDDMQIIKAKVGLSAQKIQEMSLHSQKIGAIIETIDDIASQTNLLALNAAIEAARAGEYGKGFAVVADEVRKLAEQSSEATSEISALIEGIQSTVYDSVSAMEAGAAEVDTGVVRANEAGQALANILVAVDAVDNQVRDISTAAQQMDVASNELFDAIETVSAVVGKNKAAAEEIATGSAEVSQAIDNIAETSASNSTTAEEISASTQQMSTQVKEMTISAQTLDTMAQGLREIIGKFKLNEEGVGEIEVMNELLPTPSLSDTKSVIAVGTGANGLHNEILNVVE